jgi:hypothetical protein
VATQEGLKFVHLEEHEGTKKLVLKESETLFKELEVLQVV